MVNVQVARTSHKRVHPRRPPTPPPSSSECTLQLPFPPTLNALAAPHLGQLRLRYSRPLRVRGSQEDIVPLLVSHRRRLHAAGSRLRAVEVVLPLEQMRHGVIRPGVDREGGVRFNFASF